MKTKIILQNIVQTVIFSMAMLLWSPTSIFAFQSPSNEASQNYTEYTGTVIDANTKDALVFANLSINDTNISTITNSEGEFLLKVPNDFSDKTILITYLGYHSKEIPIRELTESMEIGLEESYTKLGEINISVVKDAKALVKKSLETKDEQFYNQDALMTAFYRETIKKRRRNASLAEAVVQIYKQPYTSSRTDAVQLVKTRKSVDYSRLDTLALKLQGGPYNSLYVDVMKYPEFIFNEDNLNSYDFSFGKSTEINGNAVYVVNFKQKPGVVEPLYYGKLYIDSQTYALTSAIYNLNVENRELAANMFVRRKPRKVNVWPTEAAYRVDYRQNNGKWHFGYSNIQLTFKVDWEGKLFNSLYSLNAEIAVTNWQQNLTGNTKPKNRMNSNLILSEEASGFSDPDFWGEYNIIEPEKSIESAIKKISRQLERQ